MSEATEKQLTALLDEDLLSCIICKNQLRDPVLLSCLHNVCRNCMEEDVAIHGTGYAQCPSCCVTTEINLIQDNLLVAGQIACRTALKNADTCGLCRQEGNTYESSSTWCLQCQECLCDRCSAEHRKHIRSHQCVPRNETTNWSELLSIIPRPCSEHGKVLELVCLTCRRPVCLECAMSSCANASHEVRMLNDPRTKARLDEIKERIERLIATFESVSGVILMHVNLPDRLVTDRDFALYRLRAAKKSVLDAVTVAYERAEEAILDCHDVLQTKAAELRREAELLKQTVQSGVRYLQQVMSTNDAIGVFSQMTQVESCLDTLPTKLSDVRVPLDSSRLVSLNIRLPKDLEQITGAWIGLPKLLTDSLCFEQPDPPKDEVDYNTRKELLLTQLDGENKHLQQQLEVLKVQLRAKEQQSQRDKLQLDEVRLQMQRLQQKKPQRQQYRYPDMETSQQLQQYDCD